MIRKAIFTVAALALVSAWAFKDMIFPPEVMTGAQVKVRDGDTLTLAGKDVRLYGIDAPEYLQTCKNVDGKNWPCGAMARTKLVTLIDGAVVTCLSKANDKYGRAIATCSTPKVPDLGLALVEAGFAVSGAGGGEGPYTISESLAEVEHRGIWQGEFTPPGDWREANPRENAAILNKDKTL
jgi:endonuclease YncB( thermonuclease family)